MAVPCSARAGNYWLSGKNSHRAGQGIGDQVEALVLDIVPAASPSRLSWAVPSGAWPGRPEPGSSCTSVPAARRRQHLKMSLGKSRPTPPLPTATLLYWCTLFTRTGTARSSPHQRASQRSAGLHPADRAPERCHGSCRRRYRGTSDRHLLTEVLLPAELPAAGGQHRYRRGAGTSAPAV